MYHSSDMFSLSFSLIYMYYSNMKYNCQCYLKTGVYLQNIKKAIGGNKMNYSLHSDHISLSMVMEQNKNQFTKSEQKIFTYVMNHFDHLIYKSLTEIANACQVGEATVLRFCRKLGFKGYQDFKLALARELSTHQKNDTAKTYVSKIRNNMVQANEYTYALVDDIQLKEAIDALDKSRHVVVYGVSSSGI